MYKPSFRQLQIFEAVARHRNFTRGAEELFLTQSSVSSQLKQLKNSIGHPILEQIGKRIEITPVGERLLRLYDDIRLNLKSFDEDMAQLSDPTAGEVSVSCVNTCQYFLPRVLGKFYEHYPGISIRFKVFNREQIIERINNNVDDLFIMDYIREELDVKAIPFVDNPLVIVAHPKHKMSQQSNISLQALENEKFVAREPGSGTRRETELFFKEHHLRIRSQIELGSSEAIKQGILGGLGIGVLSQYAVAVELDLGLLTKLDVQGFPLMRKWNIAYPSWKVVSPVARTFLDFLKTDGRDIATSVLHPQSDQHQQAALRLVY